MENIFEKKDSFRVYISLSLPLVCSMVVSIIYSMADTYFVSATQNTLLVAGVSVCAPIFTLLMAMGNVFAQGGSSLISRLLGQKDYDGVRRVTAFSFYAAITAGIVAGIILLTFHTPVLYAMGADADTFSQANSYYTCLAVGAPLIVVSFIPSNQLRAEGLSRESMIGSILGAAINIILDPILISTLKMGASGAAAASVIGYLFTDIYYIWVILKKAHCYSLNPRMLRLPKEWAIHCLVLGISNGLANITQSICQMIMNHYLLSYGNDKIAAMGIALKVNNISCLVLVAFAFASQPVIGYFYGADQRERMWKLIRQIAVFLFVLSAAITAVVLPGASGLMSLFLKDPDIVATGAHMIRLLSITSVFMTLELFIMIIFLAMGKAAEGLILSTSRQGYIFLILFVIFMNLWGYEGILCTQAAADIFSFLLSIILIRKLLTSHSLTTA